MSEFLTSHIQGDLTISPSFTDTGTLHSNFLEETTLNEGISINTSSLSTKKDIKFKNSGSLSTDLQLDSQSSFNIVNNAGMIKILSDSTKGIVINDTNGNVEITSTVDSIDEFTGSLITSGGAVIGKTLNIKENLNTLDGVSSFQNTNGSQGVVNIVNTNSSGTSSISFKNSSDVDKLQIGWGNSTAISPLNDVSYLQSVNGSELVIRANSQDSIKISTNGSVDFYSTLSSSSITSGSMRLLGGISISNTTDASAVASGGTFTTAGGMSIGKKLYLGDTLNIRSISSPPDPVSGISRFYVDDLDKKLKSKNNVGEITTYQPTTTKGDLQTHNGTTQIRLPVGQDGYVLKADSLEPGGLKWDISTATGSQSSNVFNIHSTGISTTITEDPIGSFINFCYPRIQDGSSSTFIYSKTNPSIQGVTVSLNSNTSLLNFGRISGNYPAYSGFRVSKNYTEGNGDYIQNSNEYFSKIELNLSGTSWSSLNTSLFGCFCYSIYSTEGGSSCAFIICKNKSSLNAGNVVRLATSPSLTNGRLNLRWLSGSGIDLRKNAPGEDGVYYIKDIFELSTSFDIVLTGTTKTSIPSSIFNFYQSKSIMIKITSLEDYPNGIFTISKNSVFRSGNKSQIRSPGSGTGEFLTVFWDQTKGLEISKDGVNYDGTYTVTLSKF